MTDMAEQKIREYVFETLALRVTPDYVGLESIDDILYDLDQAPSGA